MRAHLLLDFTSLDPFIGDEPNLGAPRIVVDPQSVPYHVLEQGFARDSSRPHERKATGIGLSRYFIREAKRGPYGTGFPDRFKRRGFDRRLGLGPLACFLNFALLSPPPQGENGSDGESKNEYSGEYRDARWVHRPVSLRSCPQATGQC
jgi:hypothetical protein